jgi:stage IV sporulation protein B
MQTDDENVVSLMPMCSISQDGRPVGAVTHVLVNDPTAGYGVFIENMLNTAGQSNDRGDFASVILLLFVL